MFIFNILNFNEIQIILNETALFSAVEKENIEIIKLLLMSDKIDVNILSILIFFFVMKLKSYISIIFLMYMF